MVLSLDCASNVTHNQDRSGYVQIEFHEASQTKIRRIEPKWTQKDSQSLTHFKRE